jgi:hypothetical protein
VTTGCCEQDNEPTASIKGSEFLTSWQLLASEKGSVSWRFKQNEEILRQPLFC